MTGCEGACSGHEYSNLVPVALRTLLTLPCCQRDPLRWIHLQPVRSVRSVRCCEAGLGKCLLQVVVRDVQVLNAEPGTHETFIQFVFSPLTPLISASLSSASSFKLVDSMLPRRL